MKENRTKLRSTIALVVILTITGIITAFPSTMAQDVTYTKTTYAIIGATPNPIGVNQQVLLHIGITDPLQRASDSWTGLTVTVTKPNGETETLGPYTTDATGGTGDIYIPDMVGKYKLQTHFPDQTYVYDETSRVPFEGPVLMKASDSPILELVVQEESRVYYPDDPLPSEYWTRPINAQQRGWSSIAGSWIYQSESWFVPYNEDAPDAAHILWTKPFALGGLAGGTSGDHAMECGAAYEQKAQPPLLMNGILLYDGFEDQGRSNVEQEAVAVDVHTGEQLWRRPLITSEGEVVKIGRYGFGQQFYWDSYNYHGVFSYIWATSGDDWHAFDPFSGRWVYTMKGVPDGEMVYGPKGEIYIYSVDLENGWLSLWNSSRVVSDEGSWRPQGDVYDAEGTARGIEWNKTITTGLPGGVDAVFYMDQMIGSVLPGTTMIGRDDLPFEMWALSLKPGEEGTLLWHNNWDAPQGDLSFRFVEASQEDGIFTYFAKETYQHYGFSLETGELVWGPSEPEHYLKIYGVRSAVAYGNLYSGYMDGVMYCYDIKTGDRKWEYALVDEYTEILWGDNWPIAEFFITDGKIYMVHGEHSPIDPKPRGGPMICLDAETGEELWKINGMYHYYRMQFVIGDSIICLANTYDQRYYAFGKGPSETTVTATGAAQGDGVLIEGMVIDISPGTQDYALTSRFPKGVPAISDGDMSKWMNYVYQQKARPEDLTGVPVEIRIEKPDGETEWLATVTSDGYGNYAYNYYPQNEGLYKVMATFPGSNSYWPSTVETHFAVGPTSTPSTPIQPEPAKEATSLISTEVAIVATVVVAAIIGVTAYWFLKRK